jgi:predicted aspartyl protease
MENSVRIPLFSLLLLLSSASRTLADDPCHLVRMAAFDMSIDSAGGAYVPNTIAGQTVNMLIDTGGIFTMLTEQSVEKLGLNRKNTFGSGEIMFGGKKIQFYVETNDVNLGGLKADHVPMQVLPDGFLPPEIGGTIAPNILRHYDVDFDFANAKLNLFSPDHCEGKVIYWSTAAAGQVPIGIDQEGHIDVPVQIDGQDVRAALDTGSSRSLMSLEFAKLIFGIDGNDPKLIPAKGEDSARAFHYPFSKLTMNDIAVQNPDIVLVSDSVSHLFDGRTKLILGMGILRQLHLYIAYREKKLYVTAASAH